MENCGFWFEDFDNGVMFRVMIMLSSGTTNAKGLVRHLQDACLAVLAVSFDGALSASTVVP